jgi:hypothetical protein
VTLPGCGDFIGIRGDPGANSTAIKRLATFVLVVAIASVPPVFMRWYRAIDTSETRCGYRNLLKPDYSGELADGVKIRREGSEVRLDFTGLTNWSKVCLTSMREDSFEFADRADDPANRPGFHRRVNNTTGSGTTSYQAGISDQGSKDVIEDNYICGLGYPGTDTGGLFAIDVTSTNDPKVKDNTICGSAPVAMASMLTVQRRGATKPAPIQ